MSGKTYGYTLENLLTSGSGAVTAAYDPMLRLYQVAGAATTRFGYNGVNALAEYNAAGALQRRFVFDDGGQAVVQYEGTGTATPRYLGHDERGSVISVTDSAGTLIAINRYDEYGRPGAANIGRFQYTGQKWISELGLYDYKARMYAAQLGRFVQPDPIGYADSPNLYNYVLGDPVNLVDPWGLDSTSGGDVIIHGGVNCVLHPALCGQGTVPIDTRPDVNPGGNESGGGGDDRGCKGNCTPIVISGERFRPLSEVEIHFYSIFYDPDLLRQIIILNGLPVPMFESEYGGLTVSKKFIYISSRLYRKNMLSNQFSAQVLGHELYHATVQYAHGVTIWDFMAAMAQCHCTGSGSALEKPAYIMDSTILQMYQNGVR